MAGPITGWIHQRHILGWWGNSRGSFGSDESCSRCKNLQKHRRVTWIIWIYKQDVSCCFFVDPCWFDFCIARLHWWESFTGRWLVLHHFSPVDLVAINWGVYLPSLDESIVTIVYDMYIYIYIHMSRLVYIPFYLSSLWLSKKICLTPIVCWWNHVESLHGFFCQRGCEAGGLLRCWLSALCWRKPKIVGWLALNLFCASTRSARSFKSAIFWYNGEYKGNMFFLRVFKQIHVFRFCLDF